MARVKLFVGNLAGSTNEEQLHDLFSAYGSVIDVRIDRDSETGYSRGTAIVDMEVNDADTVINAVNGKEFGGHPLRVNESADKDLIRRKEQVRPRPKATDRTTSDDRGSSSRRHR